MHESYAIQDLNPGTVTLMACKTVQPHEPPHPPETRAHLKLKRTFRRFVFLALMEYALVNVILGDGGQEACMRQHKLLKVGSPSVNEWLLFFFKKQILLNFYEISSLLRLFQKDV